MADLFQFAWGFWTSGYQVIDGQLLMGKDGHFDSGKWQPLERVLVPKPQTEQQSHGVHFPLQDNPALFRTFADLQLTEDSICSFATRYGFLETPRHVRNAGSGESIYFWYVQIDLMKRAVNLWDMARDQDLPGLANFITWRATDRCEYVSKADYDTFHTEEHSLFSLETHPEFFRHLIPGNLVQPAKSVVQGIVNRQLDKRVSPTLFWENNWFRLGFYLEPRSLIGALWLQFANSIDRNPQYRRCEQCHGWFELSPSVNRNDRLYCSNACRTKAYRRRKETKPETKEQRARARRKKPRRAIAVMRKRGKS